ncbi:hypothetical protein [Achromobacter sp. AONIH1]|jgi:hypothetical protein|uniref:hypothetical protein n=1 Tax=unclassified Achromobacter TaxID=2626865 RepID=UPI000CD1D1F4|nr:hypothetical protein [Achromobacter sp. AONIH1]AUT48782.1 hypothetical protein C2U31_23965 [Achromobacter sp. AONIH1]
MKETIRMLRVQPSSLSARFAFLAIALRWTLGATPRPNRLMIGPHDLEPVGSECAFWLFAFRHACSGQSILVTRGGRWDLGASFDGDQVHAFGRRFALRQCLF